jgi:hypothetical protein
MDAFGWVDDLCEELDKSGRADLAEKIWNYNTHTRDEREEIVSALYSELLAASKSLGVPWLEVYARHFQVNMRIAMGQGEKALIDTVELFELAHREENKGCPQSICATQDLVQCYSCIDALGYAQECQQVIEEAMGRIDPTRGCFQCLTRDWADILMDFDRPQEAADYLLAQRQKVERIDRWLQPYMILSQAQAASQAGKHDEALAFMDEYERADSDLSERETMMNANAKALLLARAGRFDEALKLHLSFQQTREIPSCFGEWSKTAELLTESGGLSNDASVGFAFDAIVRHFENGGAHYDMLKVAERHVRLSLQRGAYWTAGRAVDAFERARARLRKPELVAETALKLRQAMEANPAPAMPVPGDEIMAYLQGLPEDDPNRKVERCIPWLLAGCAERPDDVALHMSTASTLANNNAADAADALLTALLKRQPDAENAWHRLLNLRLNANDDAGVEQIIRESAEPLPNVALFAKAQLAYPSEHAHCDGPRRESVNRYRRAVRAGSPRGKQGLPAINLHH